MFALLVSLAIAPLGYRASMVPPLSELTFGVQVEPAFVERLNHNSPLELA